MATFLSVRDFRPRSGSGAAAVLLLIMCSCSRSPDGNGPPSSDQKTAPPLSGPNERADSGLLAERAAGMLVERFHSVGLKASRNLNLVSVAGTKVGIVVRVNDELKQEGQHVLAAEFHVSVDGERIPSLVAGVIGIDSTPESARETTVAEWAAQYGIPIASAIADGAKPSNGRDPARASDSRIELGNVVLYHGNVGLRGRARDTTAVSTKRFLASVAETVLPCLGHKGRFRTATIMLVVDGNRVIGGECRVNGEVSPILFEQLGKLTWPEGAPKYIFKLYFVASEAK